MIKSVLQQAKMEGKIEGMMESKIEIISNAIKLGIFYNNTISKLVNLPLEEIIRIRKELKLESKYTLAYKNLSEEEKREMEKDIEN